MSSKVSIDVDRCRSMSTHVDRCRHVSEATSAHTARSLPFWCITRAFHRGGGRGHHMPAPAFVSPDRSTGGEGGGGRDPYRSMSSHGAAHGAAHVDPCRPMSSHVDPCRPMSSHVDPCRPMSSHVGPCRPMSTHVDPCRPMGRPMSSHGVAVGPCRPMSIDVDRCRPMSIDVDPCRSMSPRL